MRILVTGSSGLVGTAFVAACEARGHAVVPFDIVADPSQDIRDRDALDATMRGCDGVVHLAAISRVAWGEDAPGLCHDINVEGTRALVDVLLAQPEMPWLLFASSREIYGNPVDPLVTEDDPVAPVNHYGRSKADGETLVAKAREQGVRTATVRLSNVYGGRRDHPDRAVPALLSRAEAELDLILTGGDNYFDFVHVRDTVAGLFAVMERLQGGEGALPPIQLTTGVPTTLRQVAEMAVATTDKAVRIVEAPARAFDVSGYCGTPARANKVLGWRAEIDLARGMRELLADIRANGPLEPIDMPGGRADEAAREVMRERAG